MLRSSWLYRQRAAGRLKAHEQRAAPCSVTCSTFCASYLLHCLPIVPPSATVSVAWDTVLRFALMHVAVFTPLQAAFYVTFDSTSWHAANLVSEVLFLLSLIVRFRRGFMHDGVYIQDPVFIAAHYLRGDFLTDAIAAFPYAWLLGVRLQPTPAGSLPRSAAERLLPLLRVLRLIVPLFRFLSAGGESQGSEGHTRLNPGVTRVLRAVGLLLFTCHCIGCVWWCIGELEQDGLLDAGGNTTMRTDPTSTELWGPSPWLRETQPVANQYGHAFLWGAGMMTGYVPKDVVPHTLPEVVVTVLALFFGLIVNTAIISSTTSALQSISFKSSRVVHKMQNIHQYMRHKRVPPALSNKITTFYEYQLSPYRSGEGQHELSDLPPRLAMELILHTHQDLFRDCPIFRLVPPPTALSLVEHFEPVVFVPGEIVIQEGKTNAALYVINRGLVRVWRLEAIESSCGPSVQRTLTTLTDSDFFGEQTLLKTITSKAKQLGGEAPIECKANATCQCMSYCDMFRLTSDDFMGVLEEARNRQTNWTGKDVAGILNDAADERNTRAEHARKHSLMWAAAGEKAIRQNQQAKTRMKPAWPLASGAHSPFASGRSSSFRRFRATSRETVSSSTSASHGRETSTRISKQQQQQAAVEGGEAQEDVDAVIESSSLKLVVDAAIAALNKAAAREPGSTTTRNSEEASTSSENLNA